MTRVIVIPTLGTSPLLAAAVDSIRALGFARTVLACPGDRVAALASLHPGCRVVAEQGPGLYAAVNTGLRAEQDWDWCGYLNDDDLLRSGATTNPPDGTDIVYGNVDYLDAAGRRVGSFPVESEPRRIGRVLGAGIPALTPQGTWISRRAFEQLGGFDAALKYCGDFDFWLRAAAQGLRFFPRAETVGAFRLRPGQLSGQRPAADAELTRVCARSPLRPGPVARGLTRAGFRLRHLGLIWERRRLTGHWRSRGLFAGETP